MFSADLTCRLTYRRVLDNSPSKDNQSQDDGEPSSHSSKSLSIAGSDPERKRANSQEMSVDDDVKQYTRVQILTQKVLEEEDEYFRIRYRQSTAPLQISSAVPKRRVAQAKKRKYLNPMGPMILLHQGIESLHARHSVSSTSPPERSRGATTCTQCNSQSYARWRSSPSTKLLDKKTRSSARQHYCTPSNPAGFYCMAAQAEKPFIAGIRDCLHRQARNGAGVFRRCPFGC